MSSAAAPARPARALLAGPGARRALVEGAAGAVETAFGGGGYVRLDTGRVLLAGPRAPAGPVSLLVAGLPAGGLRPGAPATVGRGRLCVGELEVSLDGARTPAPARPEPLRRGWAGALAAALARVPPPPAALLPGLRALGAGDPERGAAALAGHGDGLTPAGDDVLAGYAAWAWSSGRPVAVESRGCAPLGRDYLRCAERGELPAPAEAVLAAIRLGDAPAAARRAAGLRCWGTSSGAALLWGMAAAAGRPPLHAERRARDG